MKKLNGNDYSTVVILEDGTVAQQVYIVNGGIPVDSGNKLFVMTGGVTLSNSSLETSMLDGGIGSKTIPANTLKAGDVLNFYWFSRLTCGTSQQSYVRLKLGGVTLKEHLKWHLG